MNDALSIECPHCGESFSLAFDAAEGSASFVIDCEVCCRPMTLAVRVSNDGEIEGLEIEAE
ncbi:MAG: CPXCG motif-containing cysteine-rich protein [bacterium]|nr:CPXCG motif-containing cysteine-rich protein [bacterium]